MGINYHVVLMCLFVESAGLFVSMAFLILKRGLEKRKNTIGKESTSESSVSAFVLRTEELRMICSSKRATETERCTDWSNIFPIIFVIRSLELA